MPLRNGKHLTFRPIGLSDTKDGSNVGLGAMSVLSNLVPSADTPNVWVPRPASTQLTDFTGAGITTPAGVTAMLVVGTRVYGMVSSATFGAKDEPFCYDTATGSFVALQGVLAGLLPTTQSLVGDWQPPCMAAITAGRIIVTHPGFIGGANPFFGWIDISSFSSNTITGTTANGSSTVTALSGNPMTAGWAPGMKFAAAGFAAGTTIKSMTATTVTLSNNASASATVGLTVTGGTPASPLWGAGNTNTNPLASVPAAVAGYNGRAYYAVANALVFSDSLVPCQVTAASQALTLGDNTNITAVAGLPLTSQIVGGTIQALVAFKGAGSVWQVTGDSSQANLQLNAINGAVGTNAPNSLCGTPVGLAYVAPDGMRIMDFAGTISDPVGGYGKGVSTPFLNVVNPSRMVAAFGQGVIRISLQNGAVGGQPWEEYWFDLDSKQWSGPHTFPSTIIKADATGSGFILAAHAINAKLWRSAAKPTVGATYIENGVTLAWAWQTALLPDNETMAMNAMIETNYMLAQPGGQNTTIQALDETGTVLDTVYQVSGGIGSTTWNSFLWGAAVWGSAAGYFKQTQIAWDQPFVFKQMSLRITGTSSTGMAVGTVYASYQQLGYSIPSGV